MSMSRQPRPKASRAWWWFSQLGVNFSSTCSGKKSKGYNYKSLKWLLEMPWMVMAEQMEFGCTNTILKRQSWNAYHHAGLMPQFSCFQNLSPCWFDASAGWKSSQTRLFLVSPQKESHANGLSDPPCPCVLYSHPTTWVKPLFTCVFLPETWRISINNVKNKYIIKLGFSGIFVL